jgi:hypothetical protein
MNLVFRVWWFAGSEIGSRVVARRSRVVVGCVPLTVAAQHLVVRCSMTLKGGEQGGQRH